MDSTGILVSLLIIGAPLALFFAMRRTQPAQGPRRTGPTAPDRSIPPADYGLARESSDRAAPAAQDTPAGTANAAAAAAAGGALILAAGMAHRHASEGGGESPHVGHSGGGPDSGSGPDGSGGDGDGGQ